MTVYFLDTSAVVRLYTTETGWVRVRNLLRSANADPATATVCCCDLALPETVSALRQIAVGPEAARRGLSARNSLGRSLPFAFVSHDSRQCRAAEGEGLDVIDPA